MMSQNRTKKIQITALALHQHRKLLFSFGRIILITVFLSELSFRNGLTFCMAGPVKWQ